MPVLTTMECIARVLYISVRSLGYFILLSQPQRINPIYRIISDNYPVRLIQTDRRKANVLAGLQVMLCIKGSYDFPLLFELS
jgi:hypothetical protein